MITVRLSTLLLWLGIFAWPAFAEDPSPTEASSFGAFLEALRTDAQAQGITQATFDAAFAGITPDARVIAAVHHQPEYGKPFGTYVNSIVSAANIAVGSRKASEWVATFDAIERQYGVDRWIIIAIWGMET
ncbi:MAG: lytic murein transglycosylase, partial [Bradyrhizobiaceae bacterium]|nr:lytic murein transglycosylase [Bradyrhizobiaceae bacterium]